ncbi:MAG: serine hydroxymethyltransferase [Alphaproteobacteria bacterium]|nr:MAG: serine hydroxymethyltransferase [Alphaproteobacteria bacterium]
MSAGEPREVFFEFIAIGTTVKVVAIDAATGTEVSIMGPANAAQADLERLALGKLKARLIREATNPQI